MSYTEYSKELEAFIAKQKQLLELDKERIQSIKVEEANKQAIPSPPEVSRKDDSLEEIANGNYPANDKLSKEKVNSQISKKTNTTQEAKPPVSRGKPSPEWSGPSSIDSTNIDHRLQDVTAGPSTPTVNISSAASSAANRAKQMSPQQDEMEQWVSDTFFSYFPSFNKKQKEKKTVLSRTRQQEYQEYLKNIPEVTTKHQQYMQKYGTGKSPGAEGTDEKGIGTTTIPPPQGGTGGTGGGGGGGQPQVRFGKSLVAEANTNYRKGSPREKLIQDLAHTDLPTILNTDTIDRRNRMLADEESRRKLEYQKELIKQIEEKRKEVERLREKEKLEEEMLTSRLEQQLKTMQLEEQLEHERLRSEKIRIANEQNHIRRLQLLANLENDHKVYNPYDGQRKAFSENGVKGAAAAHGGGGGAAAGTSSKPNQTKPSFSSGDERTKAYRYFGNQQDKPPPFVSVGPAASSPLTSEQDYESSSETTVVANDSIGPDHHRYCNGCRADIERPAFLPSHKRKQCTKCGYKRMESYSSKRDESIHRCIKCDRSMKRVNGTKTSMCAVCTLSKEAEQKSLFHAKKLPKDFRRHRSTFETDDDDVQIHRAPPVSPKPNPFKVIDIQYQESENDNGDVDVLNPVIVRNNYRKPPYSINIDKGSLFHPSKKTPEPVVSVNIRNGEVFVDNKLRMGARPASPSDLDDMQMSTTTVGEDELLDERIAKYVRHYNTLWMKRGNGRKNNSQHTDHHHHQQHHSSHHNHHHLHHREQQEEQQHADRMKGNKSGSLLPSLSPPKVYVSDRPENLKSDALKQMEKKWEVPAVERTKINEKGSTRVLTQLGAIRKQLQLEQLQMDTGGPSGYAKNY